MILNRGSVGNQPAPEDNLQAHPPTLDPRSARDVAVGADDSPAHVTAIRPTLSVTAPTTSGGPLAESLRKEGRRVQFRRGQALFTEGDLADRVFVIEHGWVIISSIAAGGREIVLGVRGPGDVIGDLSALDGAPRSASALAVGQVEATVAPGSTLTRALTEPGAAMELLRVLAARLRDADRKRLEFAALDTLGRVAWRLQELADRFGKRTSEGIEVELPLSQEQLAGWCGASRESTVKALATLRALGCITTSRRNVLIRDTASLRRHAHGAT